MEHLIQLYDSGDVLARDVGDFLHEALSRGDPALLIAPAGRVEDVCARLSQRGLDVTTVRTAQQLVVLDAREVLDDVMAGPMPDPARFRARVRAALAECRRGASLRTTGRKQNGARGRGAAGGAAQGPVVRIYGEMVDILAGEGRLEAAVRMEELWNELGKEDEFVLLCAYALRHFATSDSAKHFETILDCHTAVVPGESYRDLPDDAARLRHVAALQQRAFALKAEIEERKRVEVELREAKEEAERANRAKSGFLAVMSHELRTPLNAIVGYQDLLRQELVGPLTAEQTVYLDRIKAGADQLLGLVEQVLSLSRVREGRETLARENVELGFLIADAVSLIESVAHGKGLSLEVHLPDDPANLTTDPEKVRQVILNLLANAVAFTRRGGIDVFLRRNAEFLEVEVRDTGIGIEATDLDRIFEPFEQVDTSFTRPYGGSGLGLTVSRDVARLLGGRLDVESAPGEGSSFTLVLPAGSTPAPAPPRRGSEARPRSSRRRGEVRR